MALPGTCRACVVHSMTPAGQHGFPTAEAAKLAAKAHPGATTFVIISQQVRAGFNQAGATEFAWVGPVEFFMSRLFQAINAGIRIVEMGKSA